ncbi:hypothetical protein ACCS72_37745, partial [Rhizobium ruizarguesonis]
MLQCAAERLHDAVLPGILLPDKLEFSAEADAITGASIVLFAMQSQAQADAARQYGPYLAKDADGDGDCGSRHGDRGAA